MVIENMAFSYDPTRVIQPTPPPPPAKKGDPSVEDGQGDSTLADMEKAATPFLEKIVDEKPHVAFAGASTERGGGRAKFTLPVPPLRLTLRRLRRRVRKFAWRTFTQLFPWFDSRRPARPGVGAGAETGSGAALRRMARVRRLVTSLTRLLATKSDVVARVQKRLLSQAHGEPVGLSGSGPSGSDAGLLAAANGPGSAGASAGAESNALGNGARSKEAVEVAMYYGDVQGATTFLRLPRSAIHLILVLQSDHIVTLHHSLTHYEHMLSQSHPTYLTQLRHAGNRANARMDKAILLLTSVTVGVYLIQPTIGTFPPCSPRDSAEDDDVRHIFDERECAAQQRE